MEIEENKEYVLKVENDEVVVSNKEEKVKKTRKKERLVFLSTFFKLSL